MKKWLRGMERFEAYNGIVAMRDNNGEDNTPADYVLAIGEEKLKRELKKLIIEDEIQAVYDHYENDVVNKLKEEMLNGSLDDSWLSSMRLQHDFKQAEAHADSMLSGTQREFEEYYGDRFSDVIEDIHNWIIREIIKIYGYWEDVGGMTHGEAIGIISYHVVNRGCSVEYIKVFGDLEGAVKGIEDNFGVINTNTGQEILCYFEKEIIFIFNMEDDTILVVKFSEEE